MAPNPKMITIIVESKYPYTSNQYSSALIKITKEQYYANS